MCFYTLQESYYDGILDSSNFMQARTSCTPKMLDNLVDAQGILPWDNLRQRREEEQERTMNCDKTSWIK